MQISISQHAKERYVERLEGITGQASMAQYINKYDSKIQTDITKMIEYGTLIYTGKSLKSNSTVDIYLKDFWVVIVDSKKANVITLYQVDLGVDKELNQMFVDKLMVKLKDAKENYTKVKEETDSKVREYKNIIDGNNLTMNQYRSVIKSLEEQNQGYKSVINNINAEVDVAENDVREVIYTLIGKKSF